MVHHMTSDQESIVTAVKHVRRAARFQILKLGNSILHAFCAAAVASSGNFAHPVCISQFASKQIIQPEPIGASQISQIGYNPEFDIYRTEVRFRASSTVLPDARLLKQAKPYRGQFGSKMYGLIHSRGTSCLWENGKT